MKKNIEKIITAKETTIIIKKQQKTTTTTTTTEIVLKKNIEKIITAGDAGAFSSFTASLFFLVFFLEDGVASSCSIGVSSTLTTGSFDGSFS